MRTGAAAFTAAFELADRVGVGIKAIHAWSTIRTPTGVANTYLIDWDALEAAQWQELLDTLARWAELYPDVEVSYFVEPERCQQGAPAPRRVPFVGNRGRNVLTSTLLGFTSLNLPHRSRTGDGMPQAI